MLGIILSVDIIFEKPRLFYVFDYMWKTIKMTNRSEFLNITQT